MPFQIIEKQLSGLILLEEKVFSDERGWFSETYKKSDFQELGVPTEFLQENHSSSVEGVVRGLHFQWDKPMGKLLRVVSGVAFVAEVDIRKGSPTYGQYYTVLLRAGDRKQLWVPPGFANGFMALESNTDMVYKCTAEWNPKAESSIRWDDPEIDIPWPMDKLRYEPKLSPKDQEAQTLSEWEKRPESQHFAYQP